MAETYSLNITGAAAHHVAKGVTAASTSPLTVAKTLTLPDSAAAVGSQQQAMRNGTPVLCRMPDGSQAYQVFEPELTVLGTLPVLRRYR